MVFDWIKQPPCQRGPDPRAPAEAGKSGFEAVGGTRGVEGWAARPGGGTPCPRGGPPTTLRRAMSDATPPAATIDSVLRESRIFSPPPAFAAAASISGRAQYDALYRRSVDDPEGFWAEMA